MAICAGEHMVVDRHLSVLLVDDKRTMRSIVRGQLEQLGFQDIDEADSATDALAKLRKRRYGLIFSDWHMEEIDGLDFLMALRRDPALQDIPFIMVTGESRPDYVIAAKRAGVSGYLVKPFDPPKLKAKIDMILATRSSHLPERETAAVSAAAEAAPAADTPNLKFPGRFTSA
jgi:two-component system, chemotaxis family, chemotaxis protein CheY